MDIRLQELTKCYGSRNGNRDSEITAVNALNFVIPDGKMVGLLGPSGCGKSTTLNLISGLETPTQGKIFFGDTDVTDITPEQRGVGLVFQSYALYPHMTALQNILFPLQCLPKKTRPSKQEMLDKAMKAAKLVQIEEYLSRRPGHLSGGQQQRVAIARALVKQPKVLLLDEPLSNLDARLRLQTREELRRLQKTTGITTVFVTHDQEEAMSISDVIVVMDRGSVQQIDAPQNVYDKPGNLFVAKFLGNPPICVFDGLIRNGLLYIGDRAVMNVGNHQQGEVTVGIRPEGFVPDKNGCFQCRLTHIEVMGRDTGIVAGHPQCRSDTFRCIVNADSLGEIHDGELKFSLIPDKIHLFDKTTGNRLTRE